MCFTTRVVETRGLLYLQRSQSWLLTNDCFSAVEKQDVLKIQKSFIQTWVLTLPLGILKWRTQERPPLWQSTHSGTDNPEEEANLRLGISRHHVEAVMEKWISRFELQTLKDNSCLFMKAGPGVCSAVTAFSYLSLQTTTEFYSLLSTGKPSYAINETNSSDSNYYPVIPLFLCLSHSF